MTDIPVEELKELKTLFEDGVLDESEYALIKRRLLGLPEKQEETHKELTTDNSASENETLVEEEYDILEDMMAPSRAFIEKMSKLMELPDDEFAKAMMAEDSPLKDILAAKTAIEGDTLPYAIAEEEYKKLSDEDKAYLRSIGNDPEKIASLHFSYGQALRNNYQLWSVFEDADEASSSIIRMMVSMAEEDDSIDSIDISGNEAIGAPGKETNVSLDVAKEQLYQEYSVDNIRTFAEAFLNYAGNNKAVPTYFQISNDTKLYTVKNNEMLFNAIASCHELQVPHKDCATIEMDINYVLTSIFESNHIDGLAIDPFQPIGLFLPKDMLLKILVHGMYEDQHNGGCENKDWGIGIPEYTEEDLMTKGELLNFAMQMVLEYDLEKNGYTIVSVSDNTEAIANIVARKEREYILVAVTGYCDYEEPSIDLERKLRLEALGDTFNARCYYAPVGFRSSTDLRRFDQCLALKGDGFYSKYTGLIEVV